MFLIAIAVGIIVELAIRAIAGVQEAWNSPYYLLAGYPVICATSFLLAFFDPARKWQWAVWPMLSNLTLLLIEGGIGSLWPIALLLNGFWFAIPVLTAHLGVYAARRMRANRPYDGLN